MSFDLQAFLATPSQELLNLAKKADLLDIAAHYEVPSVNKSMLKQEIKNILVQFLIDKEILGSSALSLVLVTQTGLQMQELEIQKQFELEKLRLKQERQMQKERMEMEERVQKKRMEMEETEKEKERQMQKERMEMEERVQKERMKMEKREKEKERQFR